MERIKADDLYAYRFLSEVAVAPDGAHAAFVSRRARDDGKAITPASICWTPQPAPFAP